MRQGFTICLALTVTFTILGADAEPQSGCRPNSNGKHRYISESERLKLREKARQMFYFGYDNYMNFAFPKDELDPIHCTGRGPDYENP